MDYAVESSIYGEESNIVISSENLLAFVMIYSISDFLFIFSTEVNSALPGLPFVSDGIDVTVMPFRAFLFL